MTDNTDLPPELLERVAKAIHDYLCRRDIMQYLENEEDCAGIARAVAPLLIAHGRELEKAEVVEWLRAGAGQNISTLNVGMAQLFQRGLNSYANAIERGEHKQESKP